MILLLPVGTDGRRAGQRYRVPWVTIGFALCLVLLHLWLNRQTAEPTHAWPAHAARQVQVDEGDLDAILRKWALTPAQLDLADPYTWGSTVTYAFLHGGWTHLLGNLLFLVLLGVPIERAFGPSRVASLLAAGSISGGLVFALIAPDQSSSLVGASGAVACLMGAFTVYFWQAYIRVFYFVLVVVYPLWGVIRLPAKLLLPAWLLLETLQTLIESAGLSDGVAHSAHVGGFAAGMLTAWVSLSPVVNRGSSSTSIAPPKEERNASYGSARVLVDQDPSDHKARERALVLALQCEDYPRAVRDFDILISHFERDHLRVVKLYRTIRPIRPGLVLSERALVAVVRAGDRVEDPKVVVDASRRLIWDYPDCVEMPQILVAAARAQVAMGAPIFAHQSREVAGRLRAEQQAPGGTLRQQPDATPAVVDAAAYRVTQPTLTTPTEPAAADSAGRADPPGARRGTRPNCALHPTLLAVAHCEQCSAPVCFACSASTVGKARVCNACRAPLLAARRRLLPVEANLKALASLLKFWAFCLLLAVPVEIVDLGRFRGLAIAITLAASVVTYTLGRALSRFDERAFWPVVVLASLSVFGFPLGTVLGVFVLYLLFRSEGRSLFTAANARLRSVTPDLDPTLHSLTHNALIVVGALVALGVIVHVAPTWSRGLGSNVFEVRLSRRWHAGIPFRVSGTSQAEVVTSRYGPKDHTEMSVEGRGLITAVGEDGYPSAVRYSIKLLKVRYPDGRTIECSDFELTRKSGGRLRLTQGECWYENLKVASDMLALPAASQSAGQGIGEHAPLGHSWSIDPDLLKQELASRRDGYNAKYASGKVIFKSVDRCGSNDCLRVESRVDAESKVSNFGGTFVYDTYLELDQGWLVPERVTMLSYAHRRKVRLCNGRCNSRTVFAESDSTISIEVDDESVYFTNAATLLAAAQPGLPSP